MQEGSKDTANCLNVSLVGKARYVTPQAGRVLITQLQKPVSAASVSGYNTVEKILLKAVCKSAKLSKKDPKTFTLRAVNVENINTCDKLKELIKSQLSDDIVKQFDVGYYQGSTVVSIRSQQDQKEIWQEIKKGKKTILWCDGLKEYEKTSSNKRRRVASDDSDSDENEPKASKKISVVKEREMKLEGTLSLLKEKHGSKFTQMQYRIWSEMCVGGYHKSHEEPPTNSMFCRAGGGASQKKKPGQDVTIVETFTEVAKNLTSALSPTPSNHSNSLGTSPVRVIESRSKCYKQLADLNGLKVAGILSEEEYKTEKNSIMSSLKKL